MNKSEYIVGRFGSQSELARLLGVGQSTVQYWCSKGTIPAKWHNRIIASGKQVGIHMCRWSSVLDTRRRGGPT